MTEERRIDDRTRVTLTAIGVLGLARTGEVAVPPKVARSLGDSYSVTPRRLGLPS